MDNKSTGYIAVFRSVLNDDFWLSEKFTRGQAWLDLLLLAKYKDGFFYKREIKVEYKRGDVTQGIVNLSKRWKWSRNKTQKFINDLEKEQQVKQQKSNVITVISIENYNKYQPKKTPSETPNETTGGHQAQQQEDTHNKVNNINKEKKENKFIFKYALVDLGANENLVNDWLIVRKNKKAVNTKTAFNKFKKQIQDNNLDINFVLETCIEKSWGGFNADWIKDKPNANNKPKITGTDAVRNHLNSQIHF